jgi:Ni/Co efflux regulator RcnB
MKKFLLALLACLLASPLALADTPHASLTYVRKSHHKVQHHHAHRAGKHKARRHKSRSV